MVVHLAASCSQQAATHRAHLQRVHRGAVSRCDVLLRWDKILKRYLCTMLALLHAVNASLNGDSLPAPRSTFCCPSLPAAVGRHPRLPFFAISTTLQLPANQSDSSPAYGSNPCTAQCTHPCPQLHRQLLCCSVHRRNFLPGVHNAGSAAHRRTGRQSGTRWRMLSPRVHHTCHLLVRQLGAP